MTSILIKESHRENSTWFWQFEKQNKKNFDFESEEGFYYLLQKDGMIYLKKVSFKNWEISRLLVKTILL